jgi:hypothetical protein
VTCPKDTPVSLRPVFVVIRAGTAFSCASAFDVIMKQVSAAALLVFTAVALAPGAASAQQWVCYPFLPGETAAAAASRIAGDGAHLHRERFQVLDPSASRFVDRSRYDRLRPGWVACTKTRGAPVQLRVAGATAATGVALQPLRIGTASEIRLDPLWFLLLLLLTMPFGLREADRRVKQRRAVIAAMTRFGESVIREFEQPLAQSRDPGPALRARVRVKPRRRRLEVLLAPAPGRSYPNLSDHRKNVEYDVERVRRALGEESFVGDSIRQRGEWVVLRFRAAVRKGKAGVM